MYLGKLQIIPSIKYKNCCPIATKKNQQQNFLLQQDVVARRVTKEISAKISNFPNQYVKLKQDEHDGSLVKLFAQFESSTRSYLAKI
jgi:hypothetical protein